jgi:competence protein ComEA
MERSSTWRPIDPEGPADDDSTARPPAAPDQPAVDGVRLLVATLAGAAVLAAAGVILWAGTPQPAVVLDPGGTDPGLADLPIPGAGQAASSAPEEADLLVDVQGAVVRPGLHRLEPGSRVGDAIAVAGGYGPQLDIRAASEQLNLAEKLADGAKIYVPARGDPTPQAIAQATPPAGTGGGSGSAGGGGGLIDVNTAGQTLLETLPGIGPVTAGKIIAAREEAAFTTIDDLLARKVVGPATFEKIRQLISVAP